MTRNVCLSFLALLALPAGAQTVITAERLLDVRSGKIRSPAAVVVDGGLITAVDPSALPAGGERIDLGDMTLLPGLMDMHTHITWDFSGSSWQTMYVRQTPVDWGIFGVTAARRTLEAGFTTIRDVGSGGFADISLMRAIDAGVVEGPRIFAAAHSLSITGGHCDITGFAPGVREVDYRWGVADGVDEVLKAVRYQIKHGANVIKICATAGVFSAEGPVGAQQYTGEELKAAADEAHRHGLKIAAHAHGNDGIRASIRAGIDSIEHATFLDEETIAMAEQAGTFFVMQPYLSDYIDPEKLPPHVREKEALARPALEAGFRLAIRSKVKLAYGTDATIFPHGDNAKQFEAEVRRGQSPIESIRGATLYSAQLLGVDDRGVIEAGKLADIIAVPGDPLEDVRVLEDVRFVMKGGTVYKMP